MKKLELWCRGFGIDVDVKSIITIKADFIIRGVFRDPKEMAEAVAAIPLYFASGNPIELVKFNKKPRCQSCGSLMEPEDKTCMRCGAPQDDD